MGMRTSLDWLTVLMWYSGLSGTLIISGGTVATSITQCIPENKQVDQRTIICCADQWFHVISKKYQAGCPATDSSYTLQSDTTQSLTVSCVGSQPQAGPRQSLCSGLPVANCVENLTPPDTYFGNNISVTMDTECVDESDIRNLCADLSDTTTGHLYLASPSLFLAPGPSPHTRCRCEIHAEALGQEEILFADISASMFTITCGQRIVSDDNFTTNITNTVISLPDNSSDCVLEVDQRRAARTDGLPSHRVWTKLTGSSLTFRCNSYAISSPGTSIHTTPSSSTTMVTSRQTSSLPTTRTAPETASTTVSTSPTVALTTSRQTSEPQTTRGAIILGAVTSYQTSDITLVVTQDSGDTVTDASARYIIAGVCVGVIVLIAAVVGIVIFIRRSKTIYDSLRPRWPHSPGVQTGDADHLYDVLKPAAMSSVQQSATAGDDNQRLDRSQQLSVQGSHRRDEAAATPASHTPGYENVGMTCYTEAASESCETGPHYINV